MHYSVVFLTLLLGISTGAPIAPGPLDASAAIAVHVPKRDAQLLDVNVDIDALDELDEQVVSEVINQLGGVVKLNPRGSDVRVLDTLLATRKAA